MLIGAHVSNAGGLSNAIERGLERECDAIQIFNQSPRQWKPTAYTDDDFAAFKEARKGTRIESVIIHAVYLINCATKDKELRKKSLNSLTHALRIGDGDVTFTTADGRVVRTREPEQHGEGTGVGPTVGIRYDPANPTHVIVDASTAGRDITLAIVSLKLLVSGPVFVVLGVMRLRRLGRRSRSS